MWTLNSSAVEFCTEVVAGRQAVLGISSSWVVMVGVFPSPAAVIRSPMHVSSNKGNRCAKAGAFAITKSRPRNAGFMGGE